MSTLPPAIADVAERMADYGAAEYERGVRVGLDALEKVRAWAAGEGKGAMTRAVLLGWIDAEINSYRRQVENLGGRPWRKP